MQEYSDEVSEYMVHCLLKRQWCIAITLLHHITDKGAVHRRERCFVYIVWLDAYLFVRVGEVYLRANLRSIHVKTD
jgi:hypothetical protein